MISLEEYRSILSELLDELQEIANRIRSNHIMFATDKVFEEIYIQELAYWDEGMTIEMYNENLKRSGIQPLPVPKGMPNVHRVVERDIPEYGAYGLKILDDIGTELIGRFDGCTKCGKCVRECPEGALSIDNDGTFRVQTKKCLGTACYRCQMQCPAGVYRYDALRMA